MSKNQKKEAVPGTGVLYQLVSISVSHLASRIRIISEAGFVQDKDDPDNWISKRRHKGLEIVFDDGSHTKGTFFLYGQSKSGIPAKIVFQGRFDSINDYGDDIAVFGHAHEYAFHKISFRLLPLEYVSKSGVSPQDQILDDDDEDDSEDGDGGDEVENIETSHTVVHSGDVGQNGGTATVEIPPKLGFVKCPEDDDRPPTRAPDKYNHSGSRRVFVDTKGGDRLNREEDEAARWARERRMIKDTVPSASPGGVHRALLDAQPQLFNTDTAPAPSESSQPVVSLDSPELSEQPELKSPETTGNKGDGSSDSVPLRVPETTADRSGKDSIPQQEVIPRKRGRRRLDPGGRLASEIKRERYLAERAERKVEIAQSDTKGERSHPVATHEEPVNAQQADPELDSVEDDESEIIPPPSLGLSESIPAEIVELLGISDDDAQGLFTEEFENMAEWLDDHPSDESLADLPVKTLRELHERLDALRCACAEVQDRIEGYVVVPNSVRR